jgi:Uma2 family endonuclease
VTVEVLDQLDDDDRAEVIGGELVREAMTTFEHGDAQSSLGAELKSRFGGRGPEGRGGWWIGTEVTVVYAIDQGFRHDLAGWRKQRVPERPRGPRVSVRPDWVCEILSTNRKKDLVDKRGVLHAHGVPHYWLMDLDAMRLTVLRHHPDGYLLVGELAPGDRARIEPFEAVELEVSRLFGDLS